MVRKIKPAQPGLALAEGQPVLSPPGVDLIDDVLRRVIEMAPGFSAALAEQIGRQVRHEWAGDTVRICYVAAQTAAMRSQRNEAIRRDWQKGERLALLERRYGLSERRLRQILFDEK